MVRYCLGQLSEVEQTSFEDLFLTNDEAFEELLAVQEELIDDYVSGRLSTTDRAVFEDHFLKSPERIERVKLAAGLQHATSRAKRRGAGSLPVIDRWRFLSLPIPIWRSLPAGASLLGALALVLALSFLWVDRRRVAGDLQRVEAERAAMMHLEQGLKRELAGSRATAHDLAEKLSRESRTLGELERRLAAVRPPSTASFVLASGMLRGSGSAKKLVIPRDAEHVRLTVELDGVGENRYHAALRTAEEEEVWSQAVAIVRTSGSDRRLVLTIAAEVFQQEDDYVLTLSRRDSDGRLSPAAQYSFGIAR